MAALCFLIDPGNAYAAMRFGWIERQPICGD
jgi:hypothetical protein